MSKPPLQTTPLPQVPRVANLDLLRALAISLVIPVNLVVEGIVEAGPLGTRVLESGWIGVDLFFVLSGWLIGGLYWRERARYGNVALGRFWARRWLRTIPPYLVALALVVSAHIALGRQDAFDPSYLLFAQNYGELPIWSVSWSLCVEEHFYLALPLVLGVALRFRWGVPAAVIGAVSVSLIARILAVPDGGSQWGLWYTATHMRLEGLALGVGAAYAYHVHPARWPSLVRLSRVLAVPGLIVIAALPWLPLDVLNRYAYTGVDLAFTALLIVAVARPALPGAASQMVRAVALTSYSIYMTHTVALEGYRRVVMESLPGVPAGAHVAGAVLALVAVGAGFYWTVERPALWLRRHLAPRRSEHPSSVLAPIGFGDGSRVPPSLSEIPTVSMASPRSPHEARQFGHGRTRTRANP